MASLLRENDHGVELYFEAVLALPDAYSRSVTEPNLT
jgi:hypothetical protein